MLTQKERRMEIKRIIEEKPGIYHTALLEKIRENHSMAKKTAEENIAYLIDAREIIFFKQKTKKCYALKANDMFEDGLPLAFEIKINKVKEELESMKKSFEKHSYDAQCHMCDELYTMLDEQIKRSKRFVEDLDRGYSEYGDEYEYLRSDVIKSLKHANVDKTRHYKILDYLGNAKNVVMIKSRSVNELDEKKRSMKQSEKREEADNQSKQLHLQITRVMSDTRSIEDALKYLHAREGIQWALEHSELGQCCVSLDDAQKNAGEYMKIMIGLAEKLTMLKKGEGETEQVAQLKSHVLEIQSSLGKISKIINVLKVGGIQNKLIEALDSEISKAELHIEEMNRAYV